MLDPQLVNFVRDSLGSIWALEVLLFIRRRSPASVTHEEIVRELRATPFLVRRIVEQLASEHLVVCDTDSVVRFHASTQDREKLCDLAEQASRDRPIALRDAIMARPNAKLRNFSDAFRLSRKDKEE